jgi:hypothetical protein
VIASLADYLPLADIAKIFAVCLLVGGVAPSAVSVAIIGLDRRSRAEREGTGGAGAGLLLVVVGVAVVAALVGAGLYALFTD